MPRKERMCTEDPTRHGREAFRLRLDQVKSEQIVRNPILSDGMNKKISPS